MAHINEKKYKNAILFFAGKIQNGTLGKLKMMKLLKEMSGKDIKITHRKIKEGLNSQQHIEPLKDFDLDVFTKEELLMLEEIAAKWEKFTGSEMKAATHGEAPWIS